MESAPAMAAPMADGGKLSAEAIGKFLESGIAAMTSEETRALLKEVPKPGQKLIEIQRSQWDPLGVDRDVGCKQLDNVEQLFPGNISLLQLRNEFVLTAQRTFLQSLDDKRPDTLERKKPMPREVIMLFFDACNTRMDLPETREKLLQHLKDTKQMPNQLIIDLQRDQLEVMGFERNHGCAMLSNIGEQFPQDQELHRSFEIWRRKAQMACMQILKAHQMSGGEMPEQPFGLEGGLQEKAKKEVEGMSEEDKKAHIERFQKKVQVYLNLPPEGKMSYMKKLSEEDKLELAKAQVLMVNMMQKAWHSEQKCPTHNHQHQDVSTGIRQRAAAKPQQQQMM